MKMPARSCLILLALAGCSSNPTQPELTTGVRTVTVDRPVMLRCIKMADIPPSPMTAMPDPAANIKPLAAGAALDVQAQAVYIEQLRAALIACATAEVPK